MILSLDELRVEFGYAILGGGQVGADRLCEACVQFFDVDGAAISLHHRGVTRGTFGSSSELSRQLDELQFTFGEGPCLDSVAKSRPVLIADLHRSEEARWPAFTAAVLKLDIRAVFALPLAVDGVQVGVLDLFRHAHGALTRRQLDGGLLATQVAELPLLQLINQTIASASQSEGQGAHAMAPLARVEVYQATGMIMARLGIGPDEALIRLRGHAFAHNKTASEVAWEIVDRRLVLDNDDPDGVPAGWKGP